ncbi:MAG: hypothetical protein ACKO0M_11660 [Cyanobium sp.]
MPRLRQQLLSRGLRFADGHRHRRAPPPLQLLPALDLPTHPWGDPSQSLSITSGLEDLDLVVLRRDLWGEPAVSLLLEALEAIHHRRFGDRDDLTLLR